MLRKVVYLGYYFKELNWTQLRKFMRYTKDQSCVSKARQWFLIISNSLKYNISLLEFYQFGFFGKTPQEKRQWAGTGTMYEYHMKMNPPESRNLLSDKFRFYKAYTQFFRHEMYSCEELTIDRGLRESLIKNNEHLVLKKADGNCGSEVSFVMTKDIDASELVPLMLREKRDIVETFVRQHNALDQLSSSAVNTVRVFTKLDDNNMCIVLGCRLRISVDSPVDNLAAGNLAAPIDEETGVVVGPGVYSDITKSAQLIHPVTGVPIVGFQIPFWQATMELAREASVLHLANRSVGWDIVITPKGPGLIEGNHDWCKLLWQLPVHKGLKHLLT